MDKTLTAVFDGQVLKPDTPADLEPNVRYFSTVQSEQATKESSAWDTLETLAGSLEAPGDWAQEHDHYLYGMPRRGASNE